MQKIFSARLEEATLNELDRATRKLRMSKRQFLEEAIRLRVDRLAEDDQADVWAETLGAWQRAEPGATTIRRSRRTVQRGFERHHQRRATSGRASGR